MARGRIGSLADARAIVARSFPVTVYEPRDTAAWDEAAGRFGADPQLMPARESSYAEIRRECSTLPRDEPGLNARPAAS